MSNTVETENSRDFVEFQPKMIMVIEEEKIAKLVIDDLYFPILQVLRKGPMTVKEIEEEYNSIASQQKSDKTIYRYLKTLQQANLVTAAGQRVVMGKTATETLFSRTAYAFYLRNEFQDFWYTAEGKLVTTALGNALETLIPGKKMNVDKFQSFLGKFSGDRIDRLNDILEKADVSILQGISGLDWQRFTLFYNLASIFAVLLSEENLMTEFHTCFD